jgi:hypothetical protein
MMAHRSLKTERETRSFHRDVYVFSDVGRILHILSVHWFGHCIAFIDLNRIDNKHEVLLAMTTSVQNHVQTLQKADFYFIISKSFSRLPTKHTNPKTYLQHLESSSSSCKLLHKTQFFDSHIGFDSFHKHCGNDCPPASATCAIRCYMQTLYIISAKVSRWNEVAFDQSLSWFIASRWFASHFKHI